ncbi:WD40-repeat-containing domain protein [Papiliotrema laurentii]|uniref:WD40-repeat-containing domain protein n=1 Tax=Papiliotrema laurentii TaxID=5418 RepID=A0AAD9FQN7_PAPLA|nr:WD40-repeat-containing domain protein [Papiliotrema laurentii]
MAEGEKSTFQLAMTLHGHSADVKALNAPSPDVPLLLSGSRDGSAIVWGPGRDGLWEVKLRAQGPEGKYVNSVGMVRQGGQAHLLVGSVNGVLSVFPLPSVDAPTPDGMAEPERTLIEHTANLCCLDTSPRGLIASGSWDHTAKIWKDWKVAITIKDHSNAVWAVHFVGEDRLLTAGSDNRILLHAIDINAGTSTVLQEYGGHEQPIRGVSLTTDGKGFWSCSNDASVNIYSFDKAEPLKRLYGHNSFIYAIKTTTEGGAVTSGEDGTIRVWSEEGVQDTIAHPTNSLWSCAIVPAGNGSNYIASAADDGKIRLFTRDPSLMAPAIERERFDSEVSNRALDKSQVGDVKHADLPGPEALEREGKKEGQVIMIKNNGVVEAYAWVSRTGTWKAMGRVVDAVGSKRKQIHDGKEYDYVWDVDIAEGMPPLKLPYNVTENPFIAAHNWAVKHDVPISYIDQIVAFIEKNTEGVPLGQGSSNAYVDPYTGATRYTGSSGASSSGGGWGGDPFTGGGAYSTQQAPPPKPKGVLPVKTPLSFLTINVEPVKKKVAELNDTVKSSNPELALTAKEEANLEQAFAAASKKKATYDAESILSVIKRWPADARFPLLDLARFLSSASSEMSSVDPAFWLEACEWNTPWAASRPREINTMLALRGLANQFSTPRGKEQLARSAGYLLDRLRNSLQWQDISARRVPFVTVALNYSILAVEGLLRPDDARALLELIAFVIENETADGEVLYRALVALGNMLLSPKAVGALETTILSKVRKLAVERGRKHSEQRLKDVATEIESLK